MLISTIQLKRHDYIQRNIQRESNMTTILQILKSKGLSNSAAKKLLKSGKVRFHGVPTADGGRVVDPNDVAILHNSPRMIVGRDPVVLHREEGFVVVWKPAN